MQYQKTQAPLHMEATEKFTSSANTISIQKTHYYLFKYDHIFTSRKTVDFGLYPNRRSWFSM